MYKNENRDGLKRRIAVAAGREPADMVVKGGRIVNVFTREVVTGDIAVADGLFAAIGKPGDYEGGTEVDASGLYVCPGFIDAHMHLESTMVRPSQFATAAVPHGTTAVIADPHEIANVCGLSGLDFILRDSEGIPMDVFIMPPSCVPATDFETSGCALLAADLAPYMDNPRVRGLGEMMNYPGVIAGDDAVLDKLAVPRSGEGQVVDGHSPWLTGRELNAYITAGVHTDHECATSDAMTERLRLGMYVLLREGAATRDLEALIPGVTPENAWRCLFCTDDKHPVDIRERGHIDNNIRKAVRLGLDPVTAIQIASVNAAQCYGLHGMGAVAPGYLADFLLVEDIREMRVRQVYKNGELAAKEGKALFSPNNFEDPNVTGTMHMLTVAPDSFRLPVEGSRARVIGLRPYSVETDSIEMDIETRDGCFVCGAENDILKLAVVERHFSTGRVGLGLITGFGLKNGAIASTVAHDSHNLIVAGDNDEDMAMAANELARIDGGITIVSRGRVLQSLPLPIAGLMSNLSVEEVADVVEQMDKKAKSLGVPEGVEPFMTLAFMALPVIPHLKLTDRGLFDVVKFDFVPVSGQTKS